MGFALRSLVSETSSACRGHRRAYHTTSYRFLLRNARMTTKSVKVWGPWGCHHLRIPTVGTKKNKEASEKQDEPTGSPSQQPPSCSASTDRDEDTGPPFACQFCARTFNTKTGRGVHIRAAHPNEHDTLNTRVNIKARWSEEEAIRMARREATLVLANSPPKFINQALHKSFPNRTIEAFKVQRLNEVYRNAVRLAIAELSAPGDPSSSSSSSTESSTSDSDHLNTHLSPASDGSQPEDTNEIFLAYIRDLNVPGDLSRYGAATLLKIIDGALMRGKQATLIDLSTYLDQTFPNPATSARKRRRHEYALTQRNFYKHQSRCIKAIIDGENVAEMPPRPAMELYWRREEQSRESPRVHNEWAQDLSGVWLLVSTDEILKSEPSLNTSPGHDGISARQWRAMDITIRVRILNLILWCENVPISQRESITIFIPKKKLSKDPGNFRPITIPSIIVRQLNNILAKRIEVGLKLDARQRAFQPTDGCADNAVLLDLLLRDQHRKFSNCHLVCLDVSKAFDSVSHTAIFDTLKSYNFLSNFRSYISNTYSKAQTRFKSIGWVSDPVKPSGGIKQGDPLSPLLFNLIIDGLLRTLPSHIAATIDDTKVNALAFADDLIMAASTADGLQELIDHAETYLNSCGLRLNPAKCQSLSIQGQPKQKRTIIEDRRFLVSGRPIPNTKRDESFTYLGINFSPLGRLKFSPSTYLKEALTRLTKAPLKPQQRQHILRIAVIPRLYHPLALSTVRLSCLKKADITIRKAVRKWVALPHDVPIAFFHASACDGGLGIPSVRYKAPLLRYNRLSNVISNKCGERSCTLLSTERD